MTKLSDIVSKKKLAVFDILTNTMLGYLHRQTSSSYYYYPTTRWWEAASQKVTEKKIKKTENLLVVLAADVRHGAYAFFDRHVQQKNLQFMRQKLRMNNAHPILDVKERLSLALGEDNFVLSLFTPDKKSSGIHSVLCKTREDALIANLIINQA